MYVYTCVCVHDLANVHTVYVCVYIHIYITYLIYIYIYIYMILLRQDPEVCPDSQRVSRNDDHHDDDDDGGGNQYAPHKQHVLNPY